MTTGFVPAAEMKKAVDSWMSDAQTRRIVSLHDPIADTLAYCAKDLEERLKIVEASVKTYTTRQFAHLKGVRDGTVRKWIENGELEATKNASGDWEIPRTAVRKRKAKA